MFLRSSLIVALAGFLILGCIAPRSKAPEITQVTAPFDRYVSPAYNWNSVQRVLVIPFGNQTPFPRVGDEMRVNLAAELQRYGRYDVVVADWEDPIVHAADVFASGTFNELEMLRLARQHQADAILLGNVTQYHPYTTPRLGVSLLLISPLEGIVIGSASGLWDAREANTAVQMREYFKTTQNFPRSLMSTDRVAESPNVFQRYVCNQLAGAMDPANTNCSVTPAGGINGQQISNQPVPAQFNGTTVPPIPGQMASPQTISPQNLTPIPEPYPFPNGAIDRYEPPQTVPPVMTTPTAPN